MEKIDLDLITQQLTDEDIIDLVTGLGADRYKDTEEFIVFPTICHNEFSEEASMKLYYYKQNKLFHCYTECDSSFNIFTLFQKVYDLKEIKYNFYDILQKILNKTNVTNLYSFEDKEYKSEISKYRKKKTKKDLEIYDEKILNVFSKHYPIEWIAEGITPDIMDKYNILYSISRNKIIIPHYDIDGNLIGIRGRALNEYELENKYMPIEIEGKWYSHPLSSNLYGLNINKEHISKYHRAIIYEGEKSVLKHNVFFPDWSIGVASCGSTINKNQLNLLIYNFKLLEVTIAFDKEYINFSDAKGRKYFKKLEELCKKYSNYCNFSFIFDKENLLKEKDSPVDRGKKNFEKLYEKRIKIGSRLY